MERFEDVFPTKNGDFPVSYVSLPQDILSDPGFCLTHMIVTACFFGRRCLLPCFFLFATHHLVAPCHGHALEFDFAARGCQQILGFA